MIDQDHYNQLYDQLLLLFQNPLLKELPFFADFKDKWIKILSDNILNPIIASTDSEQDNQGYTQKLILDSGFSFELHYDILLLQTFYYKEKKNGINLFYSPCNLMYRNEPGVLKLNDCECTYNVYDKKCEVIESKFITPPFVSYLPIIPKSYVVVDANHRISDIINQKKYKIQAFLIRPEYTPIFLISSAEMAAFFFLKDICNIIYENNSQISNIKENLSIYANPSVIDTLKSRKRMN